MAYRTFRIAALTAVLLAGGAMTAQAAPDDEIKYRDGKPVGQTETTKDASGAARGAQGAPDDQIKYRDGQPVGGAGTRQDTAAGGAMADEAKPAKKSMKRSSGKKMSMKKASSRKAGMAKRKPSAKRLQSPSARM